MAVAPFGRHLYSQIVVPLVLAALFVGVTATIIAVFFLSALTDRWIDQMAESATSNLQERFDVQAESMQRAAKFASEDARMKEALAEEDINGAAGLLTQSNVALGFDTMLLLDSSGEVVAATGDTEVEPGDRPLGAEERSFSELNMAYATFLTVDDVLTLTAFQPISMPDGSVYTLALSEDVDDQFLRDLAGGVGDAYCFYDSDLAQVACSLDTDTSEAPTGLLQRAIDEPAPAVIEALDEAGTHESGAGAVELGDATYRVWAQKLALEESPLEDRHGYIVSVVSQAVTDEAGRTTTQLILMWSVVAVLALVGLGVWVARRVSNPLAEVSAGAQRVADGDFSTRIEVSGTNEIAELAESFNTMTESLKERSESLTKKVLELATLYEMSRALGSTLEMSVLLESVLDSALRIFNLELGYVTVRDPETDELTLKAWRGPDETPPDERGLRNSMSEWVIREGRPLIFNPTDSPGEGQVDVVSGALAALCVPLTTPEGSIGAIIVGSHDPEFRFDSDDVRLLSTIANHVTIAIGNIELFSSLQDAYLSTVRSLAAAVDAKDPYTRGHSDRVAAYAVMIGEKMGLTHEQRVALEMAAYLHDIGKIGIREDILLKPGKLSEAEMAQMTHHPLIGANILKPVGFPWPITPIVRHHHERWDGEGYPAGLRGEESPLLARILTAADAFEAMTSDRPYRRGRSQEEGIAELKSCAGAQFDERVVEAFVAALEEQTPFEENVDLDAAEETDAAEAQAIFVALAEGMLASFRRLGGPRLATNVEEDLNATFAAQSVPVTVNSGRVNTSFDELGTLDEQLIVMRAALAGIDDTLGRMSGTTLVDHFYSDALETLSDRMQRLAQSLGLGVR